MSNQYDIFISYRRKGGSDTALHLYYLLSKEGYSVSFDLDTLRAGKFADELYSRIDKCKDFVIVLNEEAFDRTIKEECPRENDWMRLELARAIEKSKNIVPVLLPGFEMPPKGVLPEDIDPIAEIHGPHRSDEYFDGFYKRLKEFLKSKPTDIKNIAVDSVASVVLQHDTFRTPDLIKDAKHNIFLHAAYYPKYADDSYYDESFRMALRNNPNITIKVILTDTDAVWADEFGYVLRNHFTCKESFRASMQGSINFFKELSISYPNNVSVVFSSALPFCPYIIIDDTILIGHYVHARIKAPAGIWMELCNPKISEMCSKNLSVDTSYVDSLDAESKAISRYIEDFQYAFNLGREI